jgi:hypothetical protein
MFLSAQGTALTLTANQPACYRHARYALTFVLMAWVGVANLPFFWESPHDYGLAGFHHFETAQFVWATPIRSGGQRSAPRLVQFTEEQNESESNASPTFRISSHPGSKRKPLLATLSLSIVSPDRLFELPGTPPPVLRL